MFLESFSVVSVLRPKEVDVIIEYALPLIAHCASRECGISAVHVCFQYLYTVKEMCHLDIVVAMFRA
jgi:hypothetical protein